MTKQVSLRLRIMMRLFEKEKREDSEQPHLGICPTYTPAGGSEGKESACNAGDIRDGSLIPGSGRSSGEGNGYSLQYSCLENPMDRGA